ncbi:hypothetical protein P5609_001430 [Bacillus licheniformis]|uniref:hypothetical protein n=1 Tax=Bacillus licheniformis TaxID=1402 RepID=UPI00018C80CB|nr:hypothetical protein [Bacillus licheniformis]MDH3162350.1 hypothetical protein [Bacillus licheniformis]MED4409037.1 hypothetical protein [Bacillus licheniformis]QDL76911.1 hypothetical protein D9Y32_05280 [Bacillus licheniformis]
MMENLTINTIGNYFVAGIDGIELIVKVIPTGFEAKLSRNGKEVKSNEVFCFKEELREKVHENIVEELVNELEFADKDLDRITQELDDQLNNFLEEVVLEGEKTHRYVN